MKKSSLMLLLVFVFWVLTSFACHFCTKLFLKEALPFLAGFNYHVIVITGLQITLCWAFASISHESYTEETTKKYTYVIFAAHACATFATNWSMAVTHAASTFAIKLLEPLTSALLQRLLLDVRLSYVQWISIPCVVYGAIVFAEDDKPRQFTVSFGTILAFISNICLSLRNVYMKKNHLSNTTFSMNNIRICLSILALLTIGIFIVQYLALFEMAPLGSVYMYSLLIGSSLFHVMYTYISTVIVLKHFSVVGHAFGNILKRFSVIGLLYMLGTRSASATNFIGLSICVTGLVVYTLSKVHETKKRIIEDFVTTHFAKTKISIIQLSVAAVVIVFLVSLKIPGSSLEVRRNSRQLYNTSEDEMLYRNSLLSRRSLSLLKPLHFSIDDFFSVDLVENPEEANKLSPLLTKRQDVIHETQRLHMSIFKSVLGKYKCAMLFDYMVSENKGDSAITVGEVTLLHKLNISIVFACKSTCTNQHLDRAQNMSMNYTEKELVILFHGGGNVIGWPRWDHRRSNVISRFMRFNIIMFPQGILNTGPKSHIDFCKNLYASHPRLTFIWRDKTSYLLGKTLFPKVSSLLSPDIAYQIGFVRRFMEPTYDIIWIQRTDKETPGYETPQAPVGFRMKVSDWTNWKTPRGTLPMEDAFLMTSNGMMFLQRGRVVVTDRLHGHIFSTLLGIPHVYIDNEQRKISNYHNTWTAGLENVVFANSSLDAVAKARQLLIKLDNDLPRINRYFSNTSE